MGIMQGICAPQVTTFLEDGNINEDEYSKISQFITNSGIKSLFVCGTTGEFVNLTIDERKRLLSAAKAGAKPGTKIMYNITAQNLKDIDELCICAAKENVDAVSLTAPYYHKYDSEAICNYFIKIASIIPDMPLYIYNIPGLTQNPISAEMLEKICAGAPNVSGIKDSSMDFMNLLLYENSNIPKDFEIITGNDAQVLTALKAGFPGAVIAMASVFPELSQSIYDSFKTGDMEKAKQAQTKVLELRQLVRAVMPVMAHKKILELQGFNVGPARFPFRELHEDESKLIKTTLEKMELI